MEIGNYILAVLGNIGPTPFLYRPHCVRSVQTTTGQYSPVRLKQARLLYDTWALTFPVFESKKKKMPGVRWPWKGSVWQTLDQERSNRNALIDLKTTLPNSKVN